MADEWGEEASWDQGDAEAPQEDTTLAPAPENTAAANEFPDALPQATMKTLEELKDEAGAWTLASDESVSASGSCCLTKLTVPLFRMQLRLYLTNYSERMMGRTKDIAKSVDDLLQDTQVPAFAAARTSTVAVSTTRCRE